jgi:GAF domain-containing protein
VSHRSDRSSFDKADRLLARQPDSEELTQTLERITGTAVEAIPEVTAASISVTYSDGTLTTVAQTDPRLVELDDLQGKLHEGPCYEAAVEDTYVVAPDLATDPRFPRYGPAAVERGVRAQAGLALFHRARSRGALNLYAEQRSVLHELVTLGPLLAHHATMTLSYALEVEDLRRAVETRTTIGRAVGIVMERYGLSEDRAFAFLSRTSQQHNVKLRHVAETLVAGIPEADDDATPVG